MCLHEITRWWELGHESASGPLGVVAASMLWHGSSGNLRTFRTYSFAPGNPGTAEVAENVAIDPLDPAAVIDFVRERRIILTVVGPEAPLAAGVQDALRRSGATVFGPSTEAFNLEGSKSFAKSVMSSAGVPTAHWRSFGTGQDAKRYVTDIGAPLVVKADGLAAGKGVSVCRGVPEALVAVDKLMDGRVGAPSRIVIEEFLAGPEVSLMCLVDGERAIPLPVAQDHKTLNDGNQGPNTGGMGAFAPVPSLSSGDIDDLVRLTVTPIIRAMKDRGAPYQGLLFAGLMLTDEGPKVLEYNCRFGDPETQAVLPVLDEDLYSLLMDCSEGRLEDRPLRQAGSAAAVVLAAHGYPSAPREGDVIHGVPCADDVLVFQAGTKRDERGLVTSGGRVLSVVGTADSIEAAAAKAYAAPIRFDGMQFRSDIGKSAKLSHTAIVGSSQSQPRRLRLAVLASGNGSNLQAMLDAGASGYLDADIVCVISHDVTAPALDRARLARVPYSYVPLEDRKDPASRRRHELALVAAVRNHDVDLVVLAGWMLVLSPEAIEALGVPIINVHPALLPVPEQPVDVPILQGMHAVRQALRMGLPYTGASVHYVTPEVDGGPVILREAVTILPDDDEKSLHGRIKLVEHRLLITAINQLSSNRSARVRPIQNQSVHLRSAPVTHLSK